MADDLRFTGKGNDNRINIDQGHEIEYWTRTLGVSEEKLREAVAAVGMFVEDVKRYLGK